MKLKWRLSFLLIISILALLTFWNYQNRVYDWDMPGYMGSMYTSEFPDSPDKVRIITYEDIKKEAPAAHYTDIIGIKQWDIPRQYFVKNTQSFTEQLPYFQIKVGYILVITLFYKLGFTAPMAVLFTSLISYFFFGIIIILYSKTPVSEEILACHNNNDRCNAIAANDVYVQGFYTRYVHFSVYADLYHWFNKKLG